MLVGVAQFESQRKSQSHLLITLRLDVNRACDPEVSLRPPLVVPLKIFANLFMIYGALVILLNAIGEELGFGADVPVEAGQDEGGYIIAQAFRAEVIGRSCGRWGSCRFHRF